MISSRLAPTDCCGVAGSSSRSEMPGRPVLLSLPSRPNRSIREAGGSRHRMPGWCRKTDSWTNGTTVRASGMRGAGLLRPADQLVLQLARQPLRLAPGELERGVLGAVTVPPPGQVVAAQGAGVVLQLHQMQPAPAEHQQVHLVPLAVAVAELEVRPGAERRVRRQQGPDEVEALGLVGELGGGYLNPALNRAAPRSRLLHVPQATRRTTGPKSPSCQQLPAIGDR